MTGKTTDRCRLVLIAPEGVYGEDFSGLLASALAGGDVASVIFPGYGLDESAYQRHLEYNVPVAQSHGAAAIIVNDTRALGRIGADGLHVDDEIEAISEAIERYSGRYIVGAGGAESRHRALEIGELRPDYIFFGRFGLDTHAGPHRRNVALAEWWAAMIEIPCVLMGGADLATLEQAAGTGAEFVALSRAVFSGGGDPGEAVAAANLVLEDYPLAVEA